MDANERSLDVSDLGETSDDLVVISHERLESGCDCNSCGPEELLAGSASANISNEILDRETVVSAPAARAIVTHSPIVAIEEPAGDEEIVEVGIVLVVELKFSVLDILVFRIKP